MAAGLALHVALRDNGGASEVRFDASEMRVSVGAVDYGLIGGRQVNHVGTAGDFEVGDVDGAFAIDVAYRAAEVSDRRERSGDSFEGGEVHVLIDVGAGDGGGSGVIVVPRSKLAVGADLAGRFRVVEAGVEGEGIAFADVIENQLIDMEDERLCPVLAGHEFEY